jgi:hypothetical protein
MDGTTHINIYSKGQTELGRLLTNFALSPFECQHGRFASVEGYWYWLTTRDESLRGLYGFMAKDKGKKAFVTYDIEPELFRKLIRIALWCKAMQTPGLIEKLISTQLPFQHYYVYGDKKVAAGYEWITQTWEDIRRSFAKGG